MALTLTKSDGPADLSGVTDLGMGLSWDTTGGGSGGLIGRLKRERGVDLDAFGVLFAGEDPVRYVGLDVTDAMDDGTVISTGDNQTGKGDGDDEFIQMKLTQVPPHITSVLFVVAAFKKGSDFDKAAKVSCKVYDGTGGTMDKVADIWPSLLGTGNAIAIAKAVRTSGISWQLEVLNTRGNVSQGDMHSLFRFAQQNH
jgi:stress response protein SCP2